MDHADFLRIKIFALKKTTLNVPSMPTLFSMAGNNGLRLLLLAVAIKKQNMISNSKKTTSN